MTKYVLGLLFLVAIIGAIFFAISGEARTEPPIPPGIYSRPMLLTVENPNLPGGKTIITNSLFLSRERQAKPIPSTEQILQFYFGKPLETKTKK